MNGEAVRLPPCGMCGGQMELRQGRMGWRVVCCRNEELHGTVTFRTAQEAIECRLQTAKARKNQRQEE